MKQKIFTLMIISVGILAGCTKQVDESITPAERQTQNQMATDIDHSVPERTPHQRFMPNELLVKFVHGYSGTARSNALAHIGGAVKERVLTNSMQEFGDDEGFVVVHTPLNVLDAVNKLHGGVGIVFAEPNYIYTHDASSADSYFKNGSLWGMYGD